MNPNIAKEIKTFAQKIAESFHVHKIILFGSHADAMATEDSDVDLLVLMDYEGHPARMAATIRQSLPFDLPLDLIVKTPRDFDNRIRKGDFFLKEISEKGKLLYAASHD